MCYNLDPTPIGTVTPCRSTRESFLSRDVSYPSYPDDGHPVSCARSRSGLTVSVKATPGRSRSADGPRPSPSAFQSGDHNASQDFAVAALEGADDPPTGI